MSDPAGLSPTRNPAPDDARERDTHVANRGREAERKWQPARARAAFHWVGVIGWAAAAILAVTVGTFWETILRLRTQMDEREERLADLSRRLQVERGWLSTLSAPQARSANMTATPAGNPSLHGRVVYDPATRRAFIVLEHMAAPSAQDYQLWAVQTGGSKSLGVIRSNEVGTAVLRVTDAGDPQGLYAFEVSLEPKGGSTKTGPSGPIVLSGTLRN